MPPVTPDLWPRGSSPATPPATDRTPPFRSASCPEQSRPRRFRAATVQGFDRVTSFVQVEHGDVPLGEARPPCTPPQAGRSGRAPRRPSRISGSLALSPAGTPPAGTARETRRPCRRARSTVPRARRTPGSARCCRRCTRAVWSGAPSCRPTEPCGGSLPRSGEGRRVGPYLTSDPRWRARRVAVSLPRSREGACPSTVRAEGRSRCPEGTTAGAAEVPTDPPPSGIRVIVSPMSCRARPPVGVRPASSDADPRIQGHRLGAEGAPCVAPRPRSTRNSWTTMNPAARPRAKYWPTFMS